MFYSVKEKWVNDLISNYQIIKHELANFLEHNPSKLNANYSNYTNNMGWKTVPLLFFTIETELLLFFPETSKILKNIPQLIGAEFSILTPNTEIKAHNGYSKQIMRTHLGLKIPNGDLGLTCEQETQQWKEGDTFSFNDGLLHSAWNKSNEDRWVLMVDTPIPESIYTAFDISKYKLENLNDKVLLSIASKETWLKWFENSKII